MRGSFPPCSALTITIRKTKTTPETEKYKQTLRFAEKVIGSVQSYINREEKM